MHLWLSTAATAETNLLGLFEGIRADKADLAKLPLQRSDAFDV